MRGTVSAVTETTSFIDLDGGLSRASIDSVYLELLNAADLIAEQL